MRNKERREDGHSLCSTGKPELVFGLIGAVGTDLAEVSRMLSSSSSESITYRTRFASASCFTRWIATVLLRRPFLHPSTTIKSAYEAGSRLRAEAGKGDVLALMSYHYSAAPSRVRKKVGRGATAYPVARTAYIIRSLKHPSEINALRDIYGRAFFVISAYSPRGESVSHRWPHSSGRSERSSRSQQLSREIGGAHPHRRGRGSTVRAERP